LSTENTPLESPKKEGDEDGEKKEFYPEEDDQEPESDDKNSSDGDKNDLARIVTYRGMKMTVG